MYYIPIVLVGKSSKTNEENFNCFYDILLIFYYQIWRKHLKYYFDVIFLHRVGAKKVFRCEMIQLVGSGVMEGIDKRIDSQKFGVREFVCKKTL